jgi:hypothetical protein
VAHLLCRGGPLDREEPWLGTEEGMTAVGM